MDDQLQQAAADVSEAAEIFAKVGRPVAAMEPAKTAEERRRQAQVVRRAASPRAWPTSSMRGLSAGRLRTPRRHLSSRVVSRAVDCMTPRLVATDEDLGITATWTGGMVAVLIDDATRRVLARAAVGDGATTVAAERILNDLVGRERQRRGKRWVTP